MNITLSKTNRYFLKRRDGMRLFGLLLCILLVACGDAKTDPEPPVPPPNKAAEIISVQLNRTNVPRYKKLEMQLELNAQYVNPYDQREVRIEVTFTAPDGAVILVSGYWDRNWKVRFTPSQVGQWQYSITVADTNGLSEPHTNNFTVSTSNEPGWLLPGNQVDSTYSSRYLAHHDGSPFYGVGHGDVFSIFSGAFDVEDLFLNMHQAKENYFLWWPQFYFSLLVDNYDDYNLANADVIDSVVQRTADEGLFLIFTVWDHSQLRDSSHAWSDGRWWRNGFKNLVSADDFFTNEEAWAWQENWYRYIIARWGYSPSIAMWQTVSEIDGTNAYENINPWHEKINNYFIENDPYRHPTTASMSGDLKWDQGHNVMDMPQVHIYADLQPGNSILTVNTAKVIAEYTQAMWLLVDRPNWIGEFGVINNRNDVDQNYYPELFHNAIWAALGAGAAMTPTEWNDFNTWGTMTDEMKQHISYLSDFVSLLPLAAWDPVPLEIGSTSHRIRAWGLAGKQGGFVWVQDHTLEGLDIALVRAGKEVRTNVSVNISGLSSGRYRIFPYNTWSGQFSDSFDITCEIQVDPICTILLPEFTSDIAFRLELL